MLSKLKFKFESFSTEFNSFVRNKNTIACFLSSIVWGILSYIYLFINNLNIYDNITNTPWGYGAGTSSGRWLLEELGNKIDEVWGTYNVPLFIGLFSILLLAVTSCIIVNILEIKNKWHCILIGGITVVFPSIAATMLYTFTVGYYSLAILFAVLGIFLVYRFKIIGYILGVFLFSFSLGIYQGYFPLIASIYIIILIKICLKGKFKFKDIILTGIKFLSSLAVGYILYRIFLKFFLYIRNIELSSYQGINEMGKIDISLLPEQIKKIYITLIELPFLNNYYGVNGSRVIRYSFLFIYLVGFIYLILSIKNNIKKKRFDLILMIGILILLFPISVDFMEVMVTKGSIHTLMQMAFICVFYLIIMVSDYSLETKDFPFLNKILSSSMVIVILISILNYSWQSNINYRAVYYENRIAENYYETLYTRIKSIDNYKQDMNIYFVGNEISDDTLTYKWKLPFRFGGSNYHINMYSSARYAAISNYLGYDYKEINTNSEIYIKNKNLIEEMDTYPNSDSIKIIGNNIFVRFE